MINGVYLAYPIDQRGPVSLVHLFNQIEGFKRDLIEQKATSWVFDPGDAFRVQHSTDGMGSVAKINRHALMEAGCVVAFLPAGVASVGVPMEIDRARSVGKHVFVVSDAESWMLDLPGIYRARDWNDETLAGMVAMIGELERPEMEWDRKDPLPWKDLADGFAIAPTRAHDDDAGLDLYVDRDTTIAPGEFADIPCGIAVELPPRSWGLVTGRSSTLRKRGLLVHPGVIDAGYRGPLFSGAWNMTSSPVTVEAGERISQLIVIHNETRRLVPVEVSSLSHTPRGANGFGSTGA